MLTFHFLLAGIAQLAEDLGHLAAGLLEESFQVSVLHVLRVEHQGARAALAALPLAGETECDLAGRPASGGLGHG